VPLSLDHTDELVEAGAGDRSTFAFTAVPTTAESMRAYIAAILDRHNASEVLPFVQQRISDGRVVGCTRFLDAKYWAGRVDPVEVEIGGTWLASDAQRSAINTEAKLLLLTYAFDTWGVNRVAIMTDARNERSRAAIARVGGVFEGVLRNHRGSYVAGEEGQPRDTAAFSITSAEWPTVRSALTARLANRAAGAP
jgi:N-acetyltransferase